MSRGWAAAGSSDAGSRPHDDCAAEGSRVIVADVYPIGPWLVAIGCIVWNAVADLVGRELPRGNEYSEVDWEVEGAGIFPLGGRGQPSSRKPCWGTSAKKRSHPSTKSARTTG
jgi:hypothetical protein